MLSAYGGEHFLQRLHFGYSPVLFKAFAIFRRGSFEAFPECTVKGAQAVEAAIQSYGCKGFVGGNNHGQSLFHAEEYQIVAEILPQSFLEKVRKVVCGISAVVGDIPEGDIFLKVGVYIFVNGFEQREQFGLLFIVVKGD